MSTLTTSYTPSPVKSNVTGARNPKQPSTLYSTIMTPVNLTLFLVSLLVVELRYSLQRAENAHGRDGRAPWKWLPPWLRRLALSVTQQPYGPSDDHDDEGRWHYHSKQRKLMKMEAEEAFQMQGHILVILVMLMAVTLGFFYLVVSRAYHGVRHLIAAQRVH